MAIVFELIVVAILAAFVLLGIKRGLVLSLCGLVGVLIAFGGAGVLAAANLHSRCAERILLLLKTGRAEDRKSVV